jgi:hypothetical protein
VEQWESRERHETHEPGSGRGTPSLPAGCAAPAAILQPCAAPDPAHRATPAGRASRPLTFFLTYPNRLEWKHTCSPNTYSLPCSSTFFFRAHMKSSKKCCRRKEVCVCVCAERGHTWGGSTSCCWLWATVFGTALVLQGPGRCWRGRGTHLAGRQVEHGAQLLDADLCPPQHRPRAGQLTRGRYGMLHTRIQGRRPLNHGMQGQVARCQHAVGQPVGWPSELAAASVSRAGCWIMLQGAYAFPGSESLLPHSRA